MNSSESKLQVPVPQSTKLSRLRLQMLSKTLCLVVPRLRISQPSGIWIERGVEVVVGPAGLRADYGAGTGEGDEVEAVRYPIELAVLADGVEEGLYQGLAPPSSASASMKDQRSVK